MINHYSHDSPIWQWLALCMHMTLIEQRSYKHGLRNKVKKIVQWLASPFVSQVLKSSSLSVRRFWERFLKPNISMVGTGIPIELSIKDFKNNSSLGFLYKSEEHLPSISVKFFPASLWTAWDWNELKFYWLVPGFTKEPSAELPLFLPFTILPNNPLRIRTFTIDCMTWKKRNMPLNDIKNYDHITVTNLSYNKNPSKPASTRMISNRVYMYLALAWSILVISTTWRFDIGIYINS